MSKNSRGHQSHVTQAFKLRRPLTYWLDPVIRDKLRNGIRDERRGGMHDGMREGTRDRRHDGTCDGMRDGTRAVF